MHSAVRDGRNGSYTSGVTRGGLRSGQFRAIWQLLCTLLLYVCLAAAWCTRVALWSESLLFRRTSDGILTTGYTQVTRRTISGQNVWIGNHR